MTEIFFCNAESGLGWCFKEISEIIHRNVQRVFFEFSDAGIRIYNADEDENVFIDIVLRKEKFSNYRLGSIGEDSFIVRSEGDTIRKSGTAPKSPEHKPKVRSPSSARSKTSKSLPELTKIPQVSTKLEPITMCINSQTLYKILRSVTKKDKISFSFQTDSEKMDQNRLKIVFGQDGKSITDTLKEDMEQHIEIPNFGEYQNRIMIDTKKFTSALKNLTTLSSLFMIRICGNDCDFLTRGSNVYDREITISRGELKRGKEKSGQKLRDMYEGVFDSNLINHIHKMGKMSRDVTLFTNKNKPAMFQADIDTFGTIKIYVRSTDLMKPREKHD